MEKQQQAPILQPFFFADQARQINPIWQRWFQLLKTRDDEIRKPPARILTADATLTTFDYGKIIFFNVGSTEALCSLPEADMQHLWAWITIIRYGNAKFTITANNNDKIEYSSYGGSLVCTEAKRVAANVTLQIIEANQWAIMAGLGTWSYD